MDLAKSEKDLLAGVKKDARAALRQTRNLRTEEMKNEKQIEEFRNVWKKTVGWKRYVPPVDHLVSLKESFGNNCLFLRSATLRQNAGWPRQSGASTGAIFLATDGIGYYWQAFTGKEGRKEQIQYKIVWEGILWAKKKGTKVFDFEGIYDARFPNEGWLGFTHFKKSFGGYEVSYPGAFVKNVWPFDL
ncbi:peptidoglycan bridge formation glycyltransferase FemA/FemB family protein [Patescibacteria group bacterium]|nr:peptidoglycan bridge formation glycyltransferase FemA/FemB family protein [Patescibacteria group bacterium]